MPGMEPLDAEGKKAWRTAMEEAEKSRQADIPDPNQPGVGGREIPECEICGRRHRPDPEVVL